MATSPPEEEHTGTSGSAEPTADLLLKWLWKIEAASLAGAIGLVMAGAYWPGVALFYLALLLLAVDSFRHFRFSGALRNFISVFLAVVGIWFTVFFVLASASLEIRDAQVFAFANKPGNRAGNIDWDEDLADVRFNVANNSAMDFSDLELSFWFDRYLAITDYAQLDSEPDVTFISQFEDVEITIGQVAPSSQFSSAPVRIRISKLRQGDSVRILFAVRDMRPLVEEIARGRAGTTDPNRFFGPRPTPTKIFAKGVYTARFRQRRIDEVVEIRIVGNL